MTINNAIKETKVYNPLFKYYKHETVIKHINHVSLKNLKNIIEQCNKEIEYLEINSYSFQNKLNIILTCSVNNVLVTKCIEFVSIILINPNKISALKVLEMIFEKEEYYNGVVPNIINFLWNHDFDEIDHGTAKNGKVWIY